MKVHNLVFMANRKADISTEVHWRDNLNQIKDDEFVVPIYRYDATLLGYWLFKRASQGIFELYQLLPADSDIHQLVIDLQGVLYSRQAALEAHQSITAYEQSLGRFD